MSNKYIFSLIHVYLLSFSMCSPKQNNDYLIGEWKDDEIIFTIKNQSEAILDLGGDSKYEGTYDIIKNDTLYFNSSGERFKVYIDKENNRLINVDKGKLNEKSSYYKDGIKNGIVRTYHSDNEIKKIEYYKDNKREGAWKEYYDDGQLEKEYEFKNDKLDGIYKHYDTKDGIIVEGLYKDGKKEGIWIRQTELPMPFEEHYINGELNKTVYQGDNGKEEIYENGTSKKIVFYNKDGIKQSEGYYENETLIKAVEFDEKGNIR